eukprot:12899304-Prorocentrum_lima.AAC.1
MNEHGRAVVVFTRDRPCHKQQEVRDLLDRGNCLLHNVLACNLGITHKPSSRPIKLRKRVLTTVKLPQLSICECGCSTEQHLHTAKGVFHTRTHELQEIHAQ